MGVAGEEAKEGQMCWHFIQGTNNHSKNWIRDNWCQTEREKEKKNNPRTLTQGKKRVEGKLLVLKTQTEASTPSVSLCLLHSRRWQKHHLLWPQGIILCPMHSASFIFNQNTNPLYKVPDSFCPAQRESVELYWPNSTSDKFLCTRQPNADSVSFLGYFPQHCQSEY